jgi:Arc/MetJ-type ribon-helix-helix transcriptional regulator
MNVTLRNRMLQILDIMVKEGYANTKSEAIRIAILNFGEKYIGEEVLVEARLDRIDSEIKAGKRRLLNTKEALGEYAKYVKG